MRLHRFYVNKPLGEEIVVESAKGEKELVHQWTRVFRYKSGDEVFLFSGSDPGTDYRYTITSVLKDRVVLTLLSREENILPTQDMTLVMALVKKDTFETVVRQATELGISRVIPVLADRSEKKNVNFGRLETVAREAAEQSGRGNVPSISQIMSLDEAFQTTEDCRNIVGSLRGGALSQAEDTKIAVWVGPEGGWTDKEEEKFVNKGFTLMKLTDTVLKADTAAVALITAVTYPKR